jgi:transcriptional regulator with XRE-family HTH domain
MVKQTPTETRFRERVTRERKRRKWSQSGVAKMLEDRGVPGLTGTTIAKVERGDRAVRIDEAAAFADIFGLPLDELIGRHLDERTRALSYVIQAITGTMHQVAPAVTALKTEFAEISAELGAFDFDGRAELDAAAQECHNALDHAASVIAGMWPLLSQAQTAAVANEIVAQQLREIRTKDGAE